MGKLFLELTKVFHKLRGSLPSLTSHILHRVWLARLPRVSESERSVCESQLNSPCIYRFFLNLSDSLLCLTLARSLCFRFRSLARSCLDAPAPFRLSHKLFHTSITSWSNQYHVACSLGTRPQKLRPHI